MGGETVLELTDLSVGYGPETPVVNTGHTRIHAGSLTCMVGPNGGGKTTLLHAIAGLRAPLGGTVSVLGRPMYDAGAYSRRERATLLSLVLTDRVAPAYLRVADLVTLGRLPHQGLGAGVGQADQEAVDRAMARTGVRSLSARLLGELSDGERQRVFIARALAQEPSVLILDEPAAHLDPPHQTALFQLLSALLEQGVVRVVLLATHHVHLALHFATRLLVVANGELESIDSSDQNVASRLETAFLSADADSHGLQLDASRGWFVPRAISRRPPPLDGS